MMKFMRIALALSVTILLPTSAVSADDMTGIKIGEKAPPFALKDQSGKERKLEDLLKNGKVAVVFHRSASW